MARKTAGPTRGRAVQSQALDDISRCGDEREQQAAGGGSREYQAARRLCHGRNVLADDQTDAESPDVDHPDQPRPRRWSARQRLKKLLGPFTARENRDSAWF